MSENWYCLVLGAELGPMSWDDLVDTMVRGALRPHDQVRREGEDWRPASTVEGLLAAVAASRPATPADDDDTGFEIDAALRRPQADDETDFEVGASSAAALASDTDFDVAADVSAPGDDADFELAVPPTAASSEDTDFEISPAAPRATSDDADFELGDPPTAASSEDTDFEISPPAPTAAGDDTDFEVTGPKATQVREPAATGAAPKPVHDLQGGARPQSESALSVAAGKSDAACSVATKAEKKKREKRAPRERIRFQFDPGKFKWVLGVAGACFLIGVGYLAYGAFGSSKSTEYRAILSGYQQLYDEINRAHQNPASATMPETKKRFTDALANLRKPLEKAEPGTIDNRLYQAGDSLIEMLANAGAKPESEAETRYTNSERSYQQQVTSVRGELGE